MEGEGEMLPADTTMTKHEKPEKEDGSDFTLLRKREIFPLQRQSSDCLEYYRSHEWFRFPRHVEPRVLAAGDGEVRGPFLRPPRKAREDISLSLLEHVAELEKKCTSSEKGSRTTWSTLCSLKLFTSGANTPVYNCNFFKSPHGTMDHGSIETN